MTVADNAWQVSDTSSRGESQLIRAILALRERLSEQHLWLPFPQSGTCFAFGQPPRPLPIGALLVLWERWPGATGRCPECGGPIHAYAFGGLLTVGWVNGVCLGCDRAADRKPGGLARVAELVPFLKDTPFRVSHGTFGRDLPGPRRPLVDALRALGAVDVPADAWADTVVRRAVRLVIHGSPASSGPGDRPAHADSGSERGPDDAPNPLYVASDSATPPFAKRRPRSARFIGAIVWAMGPASSLLEAMHLSLDRSRRYWLLWIKYDDGEGQRWSTVEEVKAYMLRRGVAPPDAARLLVSCYFRGHVGEYGDRGQPYRVSAGDLLGEDELLDFAEDASHQEDTIPDQDVAMAAAEPRSDDEEGHPSVIPAVERKDGIVFTYGGDVVRQEFVFEEEDGRVRECLAATRVAPGVYRLDETPMLSEQAAYGDVIEVLEEGQRLVFVRRVSASGLHVLRYSASRAFATSPLWEDIRERVLRMGGQWEQVFGGQLLLHVPDGAATTIDEAMKAAFAEVKEGRVTSPFYDPAGRLVVGILPTDEVVCIPASRCEGLLALRRLDGAPLLQVKGEVSVVLWQELLDKLESSEQDLDLATPFRLGDVGRDGAWPWPAAEMLRWMPRLALDTCAKTVSGPRSGSHASIPASRMDELTRIMRACGYDCVRDDAAVRVASGYWLPGTPASM